MSQETLDDQDKKEIKERMLFINHCLVHLDKEGREESLVCQV